ncbi:hypothetical protein D3Y57_17760 [Sphingomonas paeninsulae]|uniref:Phasin domain-containing protein n=2 Tax=Sphingomonas paeninsulae TaxID=2319844 RepID=A0A494TD77_SPHPE|nr:hypothetical protein D3Y57_17760 [Sphingomonas paeninsulae]
MQTVSFYDTLFEPWHRAIRLSGLMRDAAQVVNVRSRLIAEAAANPSKGDYAELGLMIPEKATAFSKAAIALSAEMSVFQASLMGSWTEMMGFGLRARLPTSAEAHQMAIRTSAALACASNVGDKALIPIAKAARANARRLK